MKTFNKFDMSYGLKKVSMQQKNKKYNAFAHRTDLKKHATELQMNQLNIILPFHSLKPNHQRIEIQTLRWIIWQSSRGAP